MGNKALLVLAWLALVLWGSSAWGEEVPLFKGQRFQGGPWRLRAEQVLYDANSQVYTAVGRVEIVQGERRLTANWAQVDGVTKIAHLQGNVVLIAGEDVFSGQEGSFNLVTRSGEMRNAHLFLKKNHFRVDSDLIRKTGEHTFYAENATVTTCDADRPAWSFQARKVNVVLEGVARSLGNTLQLAGVPVFYSPFLALPVLTKRQSGFLMPNLEFTQASGTVLQFPLYWAISNSADATFYQNYLSKRGYMQGLDLRYRGRNDAAGDLRFIYLKDGSTDTPVLNRYWVAGMIDQPLSKNIDARLTLDRVSDAAFLERFNFGYLGLSKYSRDLLTNFGRQLEQEEVKTRVSTLLASGNFPFANLTMFGRDYQRLRLDEAYPFNQAPGMNFTTLTTRLKNLPLLFGLESSYGYFLQERGGSGHRLDFHPQAWWQANPFGFLSFETRAGFRETAFLVDAADPVRAKVTTSSRELYDVKASLTSSLYKDYNFGQENGKDFYRHYFRPEVTYWNMPYYNPLRLPYYNPFDWGWVDRTSRNLPVRDGEDPFGGVNSITYGFSSNVLHRRENAQGQVVVQDMFWFRLLQGVFFNNFNMGIDGNPQPHNRVSDFLAEAEYYPSKKITLGSEVALSPYNEGVTHAKAKLVFFDTATQKYVSINYLFIKNFANQITATTYLNLFPSMKTWFTFNHTFLTSNKLERRYGLIFQKQCWGVAFSYTERPDDHRVSVTLIIPSMIEKLNRLPVYIPEGRKGEGGITREIPSY
jgi:LPS-assembly protein|uniref:LPS-assembly protein LptD n=1 Tax=Desulfobacca acetoxidans TaxID=60893 RepID=A0A7V6DPC2_9BACT